MIVMSQEVNEKQKVSENNQPYATTSTAKRFSSTYENIATAKRFSSTIK
jgi:hypothetical protein